MKTQQNANMTTKTPNPDAENCEALDKFLAECLRFTVEGTPTRDHGKNRKMLMEQAAGGDCAFFRRCRHARRECSMTAEPHPSENYRKIWTKDSVTSQKKDFGILGTVGVSCMDD